uniref:Disintegrin and metalloproteinase domain-containing protein 19-like n=1 Tax=Pundamilia nyererei TaxID=303518 RepID=A0A3B4GKR3_9CICH
MAHQENARWPVQLCWGPLISIRQCSGDFFMSLLWPVPSSMLLSLSNKSNLISNRSIHHTEETILYFCRAFLLMKDGDNVSKSFLFQDHCFYHGHVRKHPDSWVALRTCSGFRYCPYLMINCCYTVSSKNNICCVYVQFYRALNIRVPLIGLEVWTERDHKRDLDRYFQKGGGMCLYNIPNMNNLVGGKKCGNGFVEDGEECDCGEPDMLHVLCSFPPSSPSVPYACQLKQAGTMCRRPAGACDLPEYCTGASPYCPANVYLLDGSSCQYGMAYCYNGMCLTHEQQCLQLWGYGAQPAHDVCFEDVNAAGNDFGNCGKDEYGTYVKCKKSDAKCGKIQCHSAATKPKGTNAVSIDTTIKTGGTEVKCRGTYVYSTQDGQGDLPDPGLVMTGTKCGEGKVCRDRRCQNASFTELETCLARCHNNGVCNSNGNCHCNQGWAPPFCEKPGLGGSVDSGPKMAPECWEGLWRKLGNPCRHHWESLLETVS